jgi:hypothetical protein
VILVCIEMNVHPQLPTFDREAAVAKLKETADRAEAGWVEKMDFRMLREDLKVRINYSKLLYVCTDSL